MAAIGDAEILFFRHKIWLNEPILMMLNLKCMFLPQGSYIYHF